MTTEADGNVENKLKTFTGTCEYETIYFDPNNFNKKFYMN